MLFFFVFFSLPFHENFKFLKNCPYDFHEILHSHSTPRGAPACAQASKSYGWDVRNIAKISKKWPKNSHFSTFFAFLKNCPYDSNEIFYSYSTPYQSPICAMASKSYGWDLINIAKISPKMAKKQPFFDFFRFSQKLSIRFERNFLQLFYSIIESYMCNGIKIVWLGCEKHSQN